MGKSALEIFGSITWQVTALEQRVRQHQIGKSRSQLQITATTG
jgi:hypothetical protein